MQDKSLILAEELTRLKELGFVVTTYLSNAVIRFLILRDKLIAYYLQPRLTRLTLTWVLKFGLTVSTQLLLKTSVNSWLLMTPIDACT